MKNRKTETQHRKPKTEQQDPVTTSGISRTRT